MINIYVYRKGSEKVEQGLPVDMLTELIPDRDVVFWLDMEEPTEADDHILLDVFSFHPLTVEDCRANRHAPKVEEFPGYLFYIVHAVRTDTSSDRFNTIELDGYLGSNFVVTYHHEKFNSIERVRQAVSSSPVACQKGSAFLLHQIIDNIVDDYLPVMDDFDERINKLEDDIFTLKTPSNDILESILHLKRSVLRLRRISARQSDVIYRMSHGQFELISGSVLPFFRDIYDHIGRVTDLAESYRDLITGAMDAYLSVVSNRLNEIMKVLTIFSAIMLPLTFIAGVYGMNFDNMPELHSRYGYYGVWALMAGIAGVMLWLFRKRGWI
jgi:magnesium transporter